MRRCLAVPVILVLVLACASMAEAQGWVVETVNSNSFQFFGASLALDPSGSPHVAYWTPNFGLRYASFDGTTWTNVPVVPPAAPAATPSPDGAMLINTWTTSLAIDAQGRPHIVTANSNTARYTIVYWTTDALGWVSASPGIDTGGYPAIALDAEGRPRIVAERIWQNAFEYLESDAGTWSVETPLNTSWYPELAIDSQGRTHVAYASTAGELVHAWRDGGGWHFDTVDKGAAYRISIALDAADRAHVAYTLGGSGGLRLADRTSTGWSITNLVSNSTVLDCALALDRHEEPRIAFVHLADGAVDYASCTGGSWTITPIESSPSASEVSLALERDGTPHVTWIDWSVFRVRHARGLSTTDVAPAMPLRAALRVTPNPLRAGGTLALALSLPAPDRVGLEAFDTAGRRVAVRAPEEVAAGSVTLAWAPPLAHPGVYLLRWRGDSGAGGTARVAVVR